MQRAIPPAGSRLSRVRLFGCVCAIATGASACRTTDAQDTTWSRHFDGDIWSGALQEQWRRTDRAAPSAILLGTVPIALLLDDDLHEDRPPHDPTPTAKALANGLPLALAAGALGVGGWQWAHGDGGETMEVAAESLAATALATQVLKGVVGRQRPDSSSHSSFPSGHSSFAFAGATLLVRDLDQVLDPEYRAWAYLVYAPAIYVAAERVVADRHWASDVAAGAFLGVFLTNWIYDAHVRRVNEDRPTIFEPRKRLAYRLCSDMCEDRPVFGIEFGF